MEDVIVGLAKQNPSLGFYVLLVYLIVMNHGSFILRKFQGRNGNASMRGQLDSLEKTVNKTHDEVVRLLPQVERLQEDIRTIDERCDRRHRVK